MIPMIYILHIFVAVLDGKEFQIEIPNKISLRKISTPIPFEFLELLPFAFGI